VGLRLWDGYMVIVASFNEDKYANVSAVANYTCVKNEDKFF